MRTTVLYAPHPDDEALYAGGYAVFAAARGDRMILVAASDGDGSGMRPAHWSPRHLAAVREAEQVQAWRALTLYRNDNVFMHRLRWPDVLDDEAVLAEVRAGVRAMAEGMERAWGGNNGDTVEHYVAGGYLDSQSAYHRAVAEGVRDADVAVARFCKYPGHTGGTLYRPSDPAHIAACQQVDNIYRAFGRTFSVGSMFAAWRDAGYASRVYA